MPHLMSPSLIDLVLLYELSGKVKLLFITDDKDVSSKTTITIGRDYLRKNHNITYKTPVIFINTLEILNDPLLDIIDVKYTIRNPIGVITKTQTSRQVNMQLPALFLPILEYTITLTPKSGVTSGVTVNHMLDVMEYDTFEEIANIIAKKQFEEHVHEQPTELIEEIRQLRGEITELTRALREEKSDILSRIRPRGGVFR